MAVQVDVYDQLSELLANGDLDLGAGTFKLALVDSTYTFSAAHDEWADASGDEISGTGYTAGGATLASLAVTQTGGSTKWDAADVTWSTATLTCRRGILYKSGSFGGLTDPLLLSILFDDTPADISVTATDFKVIWHANGIVTLG